MAGLKATDQSIPDDYYQGIISFTKDILRQPDCGHFRTLFLRILIEMYIQQRSYLFWVDTAYR